MDIQSDGEFIEICREMELGELVKFGDLRCIVKTGVLDNFYSKVLKNFIEMN